jgi:hypothetical protein
MMSHCNTTDLGPPPKSRNSRFCLFKIFFTIHHAFVRDACIVTNVAFKILCSDVLNVKFFEEIEKK